MNEEQIGEIVIWGITALGVIFALFALRALFRSLFLIGKGRVCKGEVIKLIAACKGHQRSSNTSQSTPRILFYTDMGMPVKFTADLAEGSTHAPEYEVGDKVSVRYDPRDLSRASIDKASLMWISTSLLGFMAILFVSFGLIMADEKGMLDDDLLQTLQLTLAKISGNTTGISTGNTPGHTMAVPLHLFPEFATATPLPDWWDQVEVDDKVISNYDELQAMWMSGTYYGPTLKESARRMFKAGYLAILHNADNDFLITEAITRMDIISHDKSYPHLESMLEFTLDRYFNHNKPLNKCANCMLGDTIADITGTLSSHYGRNKRYNDVIALIDNLIGKRGHEISGYKQADLYMNYANALWLQGDRKLARDVIKLALGKWGDTHNGKYLKRTLKRYNTELNIPKRTAPGIQLVAPPY